MYLCYDLIIIRKFSNFPILFISPFHFVPPCIRCRFDWILLLIETNNNNKQEIIVVIDWVPSDVISQLPFTPGEAQLVLPAPHPSDRGSLRPDPPFETIHVMKEWRIYRAHNVRWYEDNKGVRSPAWAINPPAIIYSAHPPAHISVINNIDPRRHRRDVVRLGTAAIVELQAPALTTGCNLVVDGWACIQYCNPSSRVFPYSGLSDGNKFSELNLSFGK